MTSILYPIVAEWDDATGAWSLLSPDFPEIASVATRPGEVAAQAADAIWTAIDARREEGEKLPVPDAEVTALTKEWTYPTRNMILHVPVPDAAGAFGAFTVSIDLDQHLLARLDAEAERRRTTRSKLLAEGAEAVLRN